MADYLDILAQSAKETIDSGYYEKLAETAAPHVSLKRAIQEAEHAPLITEIKAASPSLGTIRETLDSSSIAKSMEKGGAVGISVLTEPSHFHGSLNSLIEARNTVNLPILMKDILLSPVQIEAALKLGANVVLLIVTIFDRGYCNLNLNAMIAAAHSKGLEVLLETHTAEEFRVAVDTHADLIGINNRDLTTLKVDLNITKQILEQNGTEDKIIVSESGVSSPDDLRFLHECGAQAFLVGSALMLAGNIEEKVKELVSAL